MRFNSVGRLILASFLLLPWLASCYPNPIPLDGGLQQIVATPRVFRIKSTTTVHTTVTYTISRAYPTATAPASTTHGPPLSHDAEETSRPSPTGHKATTSQTDSVTGESADVALAPKLSSGSKNAPSPLRGWFSELKDILKRLLRIDYAFGFPAHTPIDAGNDGLEMSHLGHKEHADTHKTCSLGPGRTVPCDNTYFEDVFEFGTEQSDNEDDRNHDL